jgi:hypothetical protein
MLLREETVERGQDFFMDLARCLAKERCVNTGTLTNRKDEDASRWHRMDLYVIRPGRIIA